MEYNRCIKNSFTVIGKEGESSSEEKIIQNLWDEANSHFDEVVHLVKNDNGNLVGRWIYKRVVFGWC